MKPLLCFLLLVVSIGVCVGEERRDGNWWRGNPSLANLTYIQGYFDGITEEAGNETTSLVWASTTAPQACKKTLTEAMDSVGKGMSGVFGQVTIGQLAEGLNTFYSDYRNRLIEVPHAMMMVMNAIRGVSDADNEKAIEYWRKTDSEHSSK